MADKVIYHTPLAPGDLPIKFHDNGDGTYSLYVATVGGGSAVSIADGANVVEGSTTDAAVSSDTTGTLSSKLRGLVKILADVWDSVNHRLNVGATLGAETTKVIGVTRSADGSGNLLTSTTNALDINIKSGNPTSITANAGTNLNTSALALDATLTGGTQKTKLVDTGGTNVASVSAANALKVDGSAVTQPVNNSQVGGNTIDTNSGTKTAGTQRVVLATDQPALTNKLLVTADAVTQGTAAAVAGAWPIKLVDTAGVNVAVVDANGQLETGVWKGASQANVTTAQDNFSGAPATTGLFTVGMTHAFNNTSWDRYRGNFNTTTGDTGTKTTGTLNGATQTNYNAEGAYITAKIGTVTGAVTTFQTWIQWSPDGGTTWLGLTALGANDTAVSTGKTYTWIIYPANTSQAAGATPANLVPNVGPTQLNVVNAALPRTWRWNMSLTVATSLILTEVDANYIL